LTNFSAKRKTGGVVVLRVASSIALSLIAASIISMFGAVNRSLADGAFAFGQKNGGWSADLNQDRDSSDQAKAEALAACRGTGYAAAPYCEIQTSFSKTCFAYAVQVDSNGFGWFKHDNIEVAREAAIVQCQQNGKVCQLKGSTCDKPVMAVTRETSNQEEISVQVCDQQTADAVKFALEQLIANKDAISDDERRQIIELMRNSFRCALPAKRFDDEQYSHDSYQYTGDALMLRVQIDRWVNWAAFGRTYEVTDKDQMSARYSDLTEVRVQSDKDDPTVRWVTVYCRAGVKCVTRTKETNDFRKPQVSVAPALGKVCTVADPTGTALNVRSSPNGNLTGATLGNGERVQIASVSSDASGRPWAYVTKQVAGKARSLGYVFMNYIRCN
jgi:hypothetical protein